MTPQQMARARRDSEAALCRLKKRGITQENWLQNLDNMSDSEITEMLNLRPFRKRLDEERKAQPSLTDRDRAECLRYFGG